jgi:hypothetical protein
MSGKGITSSSMYCVTLKFAVLLTPGREVRARALPSLLHGRSPCAAVDSSRVATVSLWGQINKAQPSCTQALQFLAVDWRLGAAL